ncbi:GGDEF domain-containing protein, partial [Pseudolysinimonas sp.]|uniref:GGDEF domain-containing protein n=1 Tax=Pseudolysinimonas sp. TaxID=2680009 RepID=UPI0037838513
RAVAFVTAQPGSDIFENYFGTAVSTLVEICFAVIGTLMLASVQSDRFSKLGEDDAEVGTRFRLDGILSASAFRELGETWLLRSIRERTTLVLLLVEVADLQAINIAFGRAAGDAAIRATGRIALTHTSTASLVGHLSPRRFALLLELPTNDSVEAIAARIGESVLAAPIDDQDRFRASIFCGIATTRTSGARYADLLAAAADAASLAAADAAAQWGENERQET